jgi:hypothetical protein
MSYIQQQPLYQRSQRVFINHRRWPYTYKWKFGNENLCKDRCTALLALNEVSSLGHWRDRDAIMGSGH